MKTIATHNSSIPNCILYAGERLDNGAAVGRNAYTDAYVFDSIRVNNTLKAFASLELTLTVHSHLFISSITLYRT